MDLIDIDSASPAQRREAARILVEALAHDPTAWKSADAAMVEVDKARDRDNRCAIFAVDGSAMLGWIGAIMRSDSAWELHPLAVDPPRQRGGVGTALIGALERRAAAAGVRSIWVGADDSFEATTIFGRDLYPDPIAALADLEAIRTHPLTFYRRMGFAVCGVIPDSTGPGRHDILLAKRIEASP